MPDKTDTNGQPSMEKLEREGVPMRKCISYEGAGEYGGKGGSSKPAAKPKGVLSSVPVRRGRGGY